MKHCLMKLITKQSLYKYAKLWLPVLIWASVIFSFSSTQAIKTSPVYWQDFVAKKLAHLTEYAIFAVLQFRALKGSGLGKKDSALFAVLFSAFFGASDEIHQIFTRTREPAIRDVIIDSFGAILGILVIIKLLPTAPKNIKVLAEKLQLI